MPKPGQISGPPLRLSVIVPFHRNLDQLRQCLEALRIAASQLPPTIGEYEIIVAADGAIDDPTDLAREKGARVLVVPGPKGPAVARNRAAELARGDLLAFVDTDVVVEGQALARLAMHFLTDPDLAAAFGAYDESPADAGFFSQCRNLAHSFVHQRSNREAHTFWAGLGIVRADAFAAAGGFDERFPRPSVEDIDLGYRMRAVGGRIVLDPSAQGKHLKRWTLWSGIVTDIGSRGVPWMQLFSRYGGMRNDLNVTFKYRACVVLAYVLVGCLVVAFWQPAFLAMVAACLAGLWWLDQPYYQFFISRRGLAFALRWFPFHIVHHLCNGVSFGLGRSLYLANRWLGVALPGSLPLTPWPD
jgi:glycosyltransferase involved in cell wall biosynthesis